MADNKVEVSDVPARHRYEIRFDGALAGFVMYERAPGEITLIHTEVEDAFEGHGLGSHLAAAVLDQARADGVLVRPVCPFIRSYIAEHPEYQDLVAPDFVAP